MKTELGAKPEPRQEKLTDERLAEMLVNLEGSGGWFGDIYNGLVELREHRSSLVGRDEIIALYIDPLDVRSEHQALVDEIQSRALKEQPNGR